MKLIITNKLLIRKRDKYKKYLQLILNYNKRLAILKH